MPKTINELRIWKHSHGTHQTVPMLDGQRERLIQDRVLTLHRDTARRQGKRFRSEMEPGDFFYLCHGNDVQLFGQIKSNLKNPRTTWVERGYKVIRFRLGKLSRFDRHRKAWAPSGNTTCWRVPIKDLQPFGREILKPFFGLSLNDLLKISRVKSRSSNVLPFIEEIEEGPPWLKTPQPYNSRQKSAQVDNGHAEFSRIYDPDKLATRVSAHQKCLNRFAHLFPQQRKYKSDFDLLVVNKAKVLLVEVKTIRNDSLGQLRLALGQVLYYEQLSVRIHYPRFEVSRLVVTDAKPPYYLVSFLEKYHIGLVWLPFRGKVGTSLLGKRVLKAFGARMC
ncbi:MAG TPA: hypothetical protein VG028_03615 [Terriglobia bacterium]|nr:hypothetical protein [Terriglobia bacterium]